MPELVTKRSSRARTRTAERAAERALERLGLKPATVEPLRRQAACELYRLLVGRPLNPKQLQRELRLGRIPGCYRWGRQWRIPPAALVAWLRAKGALPDDAA
jgi:hypothetical protein